MLYRAEIRICGKGNAVIWHRRINQFCRHLKHIPSSPNRTPRYSEPTLAPCLATPFRYFNAYLANYMPDQISINHVLLFVKQEMQSSSLPSTITSSHPSDMSFFSKIISFLQPDSTSFSYDASMDSYQIHRIDKRVDAKEVERALEEVELAFREADALCMGASTMLGEIRRSAVCLCLAPIRFPDHLVVG